MDLKDLSKNNWVYSRVIDIPGKAEGESFWRYCQACIKDDCGVPGVV